ncbi:MAG TPA: PhoU domain-containing protein [Chthoniobacterales bacterium]
MVEQSENRAEGGGKHRLPGFDQALETMRTDLLLMGSLVRRSFHNARLGFEQRDDDYCAAVIADDEEVDLLEKQVDKAGSDLLMRFAPLALDLRVVLATIKVNSLLEQLSDLAVSIARRARRLNQDPPLEEAGAANPVFNVLENSLELALAAFSKLDGVTAEQVRAQMEPVAQQAREADDRFSDLIPEHRQGARALVQLMAIAQGLEAVAYLLETLAEEVIYVAEARDVRHAGNKLEIA